MKVNREDFVSSGFLKIELLSLEKSFLRHNRFVLEVVMDRATVRIKKKFNQLKIFSEAVEKDVGFRLEKHLRSSQQYKSVDDFFKKINTQCIAKQNIRINLYNLLFCSIESDEESDKEEGGRKEKEKYEESKKSELSSLAPKNPLLDKKHKNSIDTLVDQKKEKDQKRQKQRQKDRGVIGRAIDSIRRRNNSEDNGQSPIRQLLKSVKTVWVGQQSDSWYQHTFTLQDCILILTRIEAGSSISSNSTSNYNSHKRYFIYLPYFSITLVSSGYYQILVDHPKLMYPIKIRLADLNATSLICDDRIVYQKYLALYSVLKQNNSNSTLKQTREEVCNWVKMHISAKKVEKLFQVEKKSIKELIVKLNHSTLTLSFSLILDHTVVLLLPILDNYSTINLQLTESRDLLLLSTFRQTTHSLPFEIQSIYDMLYNDQPKRKAELNCWGFQSKGGSYTVAVDFSTGGNWQTFYSGKPRDAFEGDQRPQEFTRDQFRIQKNRMKRILYTLQLQYAYLKQLIRYHYPVQSTVFYFTLLIFILSFDGEYLLHYFLLGLIILLLYTHPSSTAFFKTTCFFSNQAYEAFGVVWNYRGENPSKVKLKKYVAKKHFLAHFQMGSKQKRNIYKKYKRLQEILLAGQLTLTAMVTFLQKLKNTFQWYHHKKTRHLLIALTTILVIIWLIPVRLFALVGLVKMWMNGRNWNQKTKIGNRLIMGQIIKQIISQYNLTDMKPYLMQPDKGIDKRIADYTVFERKLKDCLQSVLQLQYDAGQLFSPQPLPLSINSILTFLSSGSFKLILPIQMCRKYGWSEEWSSRPGTITKIALMIYGFIIAVPSDRCILGVKKQPIDSKQEQVDDEDEDMDF